MSSTTISEMTGHTPRPMGSPSKRPMGGFGPAQLLQALPSALRKLDPRQMWHNPVMFIVEIGAALTTVIAIAEPFLGGPGSSGGTTVPVEFTWGIAIWLWLTVVFANLAEAVAEGRGKAQADTLRKTRTSTVAHLVTRYDEVVGCRGRAHAGHRGLLGRPPARRHRRGVGRRADPRRR